MKFIMTAIIPLLAFSSLSAADRIDTITNYLTNDETAVIHTFPQDKIITFSNAGSDPTQSIEKVKNLDNGTQVGSKGTFAVIKDNKIDPVKSKELAGIYSAEP